MLVIPHVLGGEVQNASSRPSKGENEKSPTKVEEVTSLWRCPINFLWFKMRKERQEDSMTRGSVIYFFKRFVAITIISTNMSLAGS